MSYKKTIVQNNPEYIGKTLLLSNAARSGLYRSPDGSHIQLEVDTQGELVVTEITRCLQLHPVKMSLHQIGRTFLHLNDPSVDQMLKYMVLPEMEVERIFNNVRYKYLEAISLSKIKTPAQFINAKYNKAFQALAGLKLYQGNTKHRKENDVFWQEAGFSPLAQQRFDGEKERNELQRILRLLKYIYRKSIPQLYAELIAIKPGLHEIWIHPDYFESIPKGTAARDLVFRMLRGQGELSEIRLQKLPSEINKNSYFSYASCHVTEGPFVFRKSVAVSYFDEIRKIHSKENMRKLQEYFYILDYCHAQLNSRKRLDEFLATAKRFTSFM